MLLEADGRRWHTRIRDLRRDHERDAEVARAGWITLRFMHEQLVGAPGEVAATVADVRQVRLVQLAGKAA
jgi:very-short-patch-repair endonuclease